MRRSPTRRPLTRSLLAADAHAGGVLFLMLGVLVAIVQTVVFTLLTMIYIGEAAAHADGH